MSTTHRTITILALCLLSVFGTRAGAAGRDDDQWGSREMPRSGVCLFKDPNFHGDYFCIESGDSRRKLPYDMRDKVSSMRMLGNVNVQVFTDERFKGASGHFLTDVRNLKHQGWNDKISSVRVTATATAWESGRFPGWGHASLPEQGACFYRDPGFKGDYFCVARGGSYTEVPEGFNDKISSIRLIRAGGVIVFGDRDFEGASAPVTSDVTDMRHGPWNDKISSIRVF